jgi:hypothetical protein
MASAVASFVISLGKDGRILSRGTISDALAKDKKLAAQALRDEQQVMQAQKEVDPAPVGDRKEADGKLVLKEEIEEGHVSWSACASSLAKRPPPAP